MARYLARLCSLALLPVAAHAQQTASLTVGPQEFKTVTEVIGARDPKPLRIVPPVIRRVNEVIKTAPAHCPGDPLTSEIETVEIMPATVEFEIIPPTYKTVTEDIVLTEGGGTWTARGDGRFTYSTFPPETRTIQRRMIDTPARSVMRRVPAVTKEITVRKHEGLGGICSPSIEVPVKTLTVTRTVIEAPAKVVEIDVPAGSKSTAKRVPVPQTVTLGDVESGDTKTATTAIFPPAPTEGMIYQPVFRRGDPRCVEWLGLSATETAATPEQGFLWPPVSPSSAAVLSARNFGPSQTPDGFEAEIREALDGLKYDSTQITKYPVPGGFALVTPLEQIDKNGRPAKPRWPQGIAPVDPFSISGWLDALATTEGRFRVMALIVTSAQADGSAAKDWLASTPPSSCGIGRSPHRVAVLTYEFEHEAPRPPALVTSTEIDHMEGSGLGWLGP